MGYTCEYDVFTRVEDDSTFAKPLATLKSFAKCWTYNNSHDDEDTSVFGTWIIGCGYWSALVFFMI